MDQYYEKWKIIREYPDYEISNWGRVRRNVQLDKSPSAWLGRLLKPKRLSKRTIVYYLNNRQKTKTVSIKYLISNYWPNIIIEFSDEWLAYIIDINSIENESNKPERVRRSKYLQRKNREYINNENLRNCVVCKKPSGANYWCDKCRTDRCDDLNSSYQWLPIETYRVHL